MNQARLNKAARALGKTTWEEVLYEAGARPFSQQVAPDAGVPVFDEVPAGNGDFDPTLLGEDNGFAIDMFPLKAVPPQARQHRQLFAVVVSGDSMAPDFRPGDTVFCALDAEHTQGMVAAYRLADGDCGLKVFERHGEEVLLIPRNPSHQIRRVPLDQIVRVAKVVAHLRAML